MWFQSEGNRQRPLVLVRSLAFDAGFADTHPRFKDTSSSLSFINIDFFLKRLRHPEDRLKIQPAFILAGLAMATLMKSSEFEYKAPGRERALWLRDAAQATLDQALTSDWVDASLAEAALVSHTTEPVMLSST